MKKMKKKKRRKPRLHPVNIDQYNWFYAYPAHMLFVHEVRDGEKYIRTDQIKIPWRRIKPAMRGYIA